MSGGIVGGGLGAVLLPIKPAQEDFMSVNGVSSASANLASGVQVQVAGRTINLPAKSRLEVYPPNQGFSVPAGGDIAVAADAVGLKNFKNAIKTGQDGMTFNFANGLVIGANCAIAYDSSGRTATAITCATPVIYYLSAGTAQLMPVSPDTVQLARSNNLGAFTDGSGVQKHETLSFDKGGIAGDLKFFGVDVPQKDAATLVNAQVTKK